MKVTLDITKLLEDWKISKEEYQKIYDLSHKQWIWILPNLLVSLWCLLVSLWLISLAPSFDLALALSIISILIWFYIREKLFENWWILASVFIILWSIFASWTYIWFLNKYVSLTEPYIYFTFWSITLFLWIMSYFARSSLLSAFSSLSICSLVWAWTWYTFASYYFFVKKPFLTIIVYFPLALLSYFLSKRVNSENEKLLTIFSNISLFMVNIAFWIWSLWWNWFSRYSRENPDFWKDIVLWAPGFSLIWLIFLLVLILFWVKQNRRFFINMWITFLSIHIYTQYFEAFWADSLSIIISWIFAIVIAIVLWKYNKKNNI